MAIGRKSMLVFIAAAMLLTGCQLVASPVDLLRTPALPPGQQELKQAVMQVLPAAAKLIVPIRSIQSSAIMEADLDGDGEKETIAFYKNKRNDFELGMLVLQKRDGNWKKLSEQKQVGTELHVADFQDVTGDGIPELLVGLSGGKGLAKELDVYTYKQNALVKLKALKYDEIAVDDLDGDGKAEIVLLQHDHAKLSTTAELYAFRKGDLVLDQQVMLEGGINGFSSVETGFAGKGRKGIFVEMGLGAHSSMTSLLVMEQGKLRSVFAADQTFQNVTTVSEDINGDGIVEIDIPQEPPDSDGIAMALMPWIHVWHRWDGKDGLVPVFQNYYDFDAGYRFDIPESWYGRYTISKETQEGESTAAFYTLGTSGRKQSKILTITGIANERWSARRQELDRDGIGYELAGTNNGYTIYAVLEPDVAAGGFRLDSATVKKLLQLYRWNSTY